MYLKKTNNGYYHFRWRVPSNELHLFHNKANIIKSLHTKNKTIALKKAKQLFNALPVLKRLLMDSHERDTNVIITHWSNEQLKSFAPKSEIDIQRTKNILHQESIKNINSNLLKYKQELLAITGTINQNHTISTKSTNENNKQALLYKLLQVNVTLVKSLSKEVQKNSANTKVLGSASQNRVTYSEAITNYLPILLNKSRARAKHKLQIPKQYQVAEKFFNNKFLKVVGANTLLPLRSAECIETLDMGFRRKDNTIARDVQEHLKAFYLWLFNNQYIPTNIAKDFAFESVVQSKRSAFTPSMVQAILTKSVGEINLLFRLYLYTGMRKSELFNCTFDESKNGFFISKGKNKNALRFIPRHSKLNDVTQKTLNKLSKKWSPDTLGRMLNDWIHENISKKQCYSLHSTRHCFNTWLANANVNRALMKSLMGHEDSNTDMSDYYTTYFETEEDKLKAVNLVNYG